ncbi:MAG: DNA-binding protein [Lachnospiraceae bacterium]|nr:DNA-binding protein [Lachnospiraceae bacterium]
MEKKLQQGLLYDFYGPLLTEHQKHIYELFVYDDLSLSEIADMEGISRQGVGDLIHRCDKALMEYEEKLGLMKRFERNKDRLLKLKCELSDANDRKLVDDIIEEL